MMSDIGTISGVVKKYAGNGRILGYPTANVAVDTPLEDGVYFGLANLAGYQANPALIFVGTPTTVGDTIRRVEAHLLDIEDKDYYGSDLELRVLHHHRTNQTFGSIEELKIAMKSDEQSGRTWLQDFLQKTN